MGLSSKQTTTIQILCSNIILSQTLYSILLACKLEDALAAPWMIVSIPALWCIILIPIGIQYYVSLKSRQIMKLGNIVMIFTAYASSTGLIVLMIVVSLKLDDHLEGSWAFIFAPIWFIIFVFSIFSCFMCPGLVDKNIQMQRQAFLLFNYIVGIFATSILLALKLDESLGGGYGMASLPLFVSFGLHYITLLYTQVKRKVFLLAEILYITAIMSTLVMCSLRLDGISIPWLCAMLPMWCVHGFWIYKILGTTQDEISRTEDTPLNPNN